MAAGDLEELTLYVSRCTRKRYNDQLHEEGAKFRGEGVPGDPVTFY